ncbi:MAG: TonB family protein [Nitrospirota bacterium]|nr:TonB family protein [Nitrospirota bacterium]MDH5767432.1 TonB family protein [Nitrospirota bacterium]
MREPSLQRTTAFSFALHITALLIIFLLFKQSHQLIIPPPYSVSLVGPEVLKRSEAGKETRMSEDKGNAALKEDTPAQKTKKITKKQEKAIEEKISAIAAKKKIEQIVRLRSIISLKAGADERKNSPETTSTDRGKGSVFDDYYSKIRKEIWQQWVFPDTGHKDLETIISIKIRKDGTITAQKIEKSSGNLIFDRSAIKAITKASPLSPPPYEMEIGVRFYP